MPSYTATQLGLNNWLEMLDSYVRASGKKRSSSRWLIIVSKSFQYRRLNVALILSMRATWLLNMPMYMKKEIIFAG
jgi:hypothetical protein